MKFNWKTALITIVIIVLIFAGIYFVIMNWPSKPKLGLGEVIFIALFFTAIFIFKKIFTSVMKERKAKKIIDEVINNKKLLLEKLKHPKVDTGGPEKVRVEKIIDMGDNLDIGMNEKGEMRINREKIVVKPKPKEKKVKKKPAPKKVKKKVRGNKKGGRNNVLAKI